MANGFKTGGRTKESSGPDAALKRMQTEARKHSKRALTELYSLMTSAPEKSTRVAAAKEILDRGFGKPGQAVTTKGELNITLSLKGTDKDL